MISRRNRWRRATTCPSRCLLSVAAMLIAGLLPEALPLQAQERQQEPAAQTAQEGRRVHVVREGDTLWDLANFYLSDPFLWPEIYRVNTMVVEDPHWIYPAEELVVPGLEELPVEIPVEVPIEEPVEVPVEPRVPGEEPEVIIPTPEVIEEVPPEEIEELRSIFTAAEITRTTLTYRRGVPVPAVAVSESDFYRSALLVPLEELGPRGELVDPTAPRGFHVEPTSTIPRYGRIYVSHPGGEPPGLGDRILLFRVERRIRPYGYVVRPTGMATIAAVHEEVSTAVVTEVYERVLIGDQVIEAESFELEPGVFAEPVPTGPSAELVALLDEQPVVSVEDFVFVSIGRNQGITVGDEFEIYAPSRQSPTGLRLPEEHIGLGRVLRVTEETATLRVLEMRHPTIDVGLPVRLVRKMPS